MTYSVRNIAIALALAIAAGVVVLLYTSSYKDQVSKDQQVVQVMVATQEIPAGTEGEKAAGMMGLKEVQTKDVAPGALTSSGGLDGKVTAQTVFAGQQVVGDVFQAPTTQAAPLLLDKTERGIRVNVDVAQGALGAVNPGDHVDLFASFEVIPPGDTAKGNWFTRRLMTDVRVLEAPVAKTSDDDKTANADGQLSDDQKSEKQTVMLAVSQEDATKLAFMEAMEKFNENAILWVAVRPPSGQAVDMDVTIENIQTMLSGGGIKASEITEKYGNFVKEQAEAQLEAQAKQNAAGSADAPALADDTAPEDGQ